MKTLDRLREREFLFVTAEARNKFKSILYALDSLQSTALAINYKESPVYRKYTQELFNYLSTVQFSLVNDSSYNRPHIYTGLIDRISRVINVISANQPESIFRMMNKMIVIKKEIETLLEQLRN